MDVCACLHRGAPDAEVLRELSEHRACATPGRLALWLESRRATRTETPHGAIWRFTRYPFYATEPVRFLGLVLPAGAVVTFEPSPRRDIAPLFNAWAMQRLCAVRGWRYPDDLCRPEDA